MNAEQQIEANYLTFRLGPEQFAIGIQAVKGIVEFGPLTRVPFTPPWIRGVINLRGSVIPVYDLALKFGLLETAVTHRTCIIIAEVRRRDDMMVIGLLADAVDEVKELRAGDILQPPEFGTAVDVRYLEGMVAAGDRFVLILNIAEVLGDGIAEVAQAVVRSGETQSSRV